LSAIALLLAACGSSSSGGSGGDGAGGSGGVTSGSGGAGGTAGSTSGTGGAGLTEPCGPGSAAALLQCVDEQRYTDDLIAIALPRPPGSAHWQTVQDLCADRFEANGFAVERHDYGSGINVIGVLTGSSKPAERVLVSAHYDSVDASCPGADDNGTGVAAVLESARVLAMGSFARTLVVACWDEEESGLVGSDAYAERAAGLGEQIHVALVYEMIGYVSHEPNSQELPFGFELVFPDLVAELAARDNRGDFIAIIDDESAAVSAARLSTYGDQLGLENSVIELAADQKSSALFGDLRRSDHASFWDRDYPAMFLTDTSEFRNSHYHCADGPDVVSDLDHGFSANVIRATVGAAADALEVE
jgi:hypothetical protein